MALDSVSRMFLLSDLLTPMAIRVAATLRLADGTAPAGVDPDALDRLLRFLTEIGVFTRDDDGAYAVTELGEVLRSDHPSGLRDRLDLDGALGRAELAFAQLLHTVRTGEPGFPAQFGMSFWDDVVGDDTRLTSFNAQMASDVKAWAPAIIGAYDWGSLGHLVDVGGGDGTLMLELSDAFPSLRGSVFELAPTVATVRVDAIAGSFFDPWPRADAYLLTAIIHDWADEPARAILRRGARDGPTRVRDREDRDRRRDGQPAHGSAVARAHGRPRALPGGARRARGICRLHTRRRPRSRRHRHPGTPLAGVWSRTGHYVAGGPKH